MKILGREPALLLGAIEAIIALFVGFDIIHWTEDQTAPVLGAVAAILSFFVRQSVTPVSKLETLTSDQVRNELSQKKLI